jgi:class 3 adenylate cyclase
MAAAANQRRLAAIMAADVVGYSRMVAADETSTLARLPPHRGATMVCGVADYVVPAISSLAGGGAGLDRRASITNAAATNCCRQLVRLLSALLLTLFGCRAVQDPILHNVASPHRNQLVGLDVELL